jgi:DnaJ domain
MKLGSKYFDSIRVKGGADAPAAKQAHICQWKGCTAEGGFKAPMGRGREGAFFSFCIDHVRQYNATYNYFDGMSDADVADFQKDALTGHRPTWKTGANAWAHGTRAPSSGPKTGATPEADPRVSDPHAFFKWRNGKDQPPGPTERQRPIKPLEKKALDRLGLGERASKAEIKARFKELVKRHHPDANGGDTRSEDTLREIIQAYNYLKQAGLV